MYFSVFKPYVFLDTPATHCSVTMEAQPQCGEKKTAQAEHHPVAQKFALLLLLLLLFFLLLLFLLLLRPTLSAHGRQAAAADGWRAAESAAEQKVQKCKAGGAVALHYIVHSRHFF